MNAPVHEPRLAHNVSRLSHLDLPGAGQVYVDGRYAYIGHIPNAQQLGTSILDVSDPRNPKIVSQIHLDDPESHSHKARVIGDIMIVNSERNMTAIGRKADELPKLRKQLRDTLGRDPTHAELAQKLGVKEPDIPAVEAQERNPYRNGGFKIYDISDRAKPKLIAFQKTHGIGVHRFDMDASYAYISTEAEGYVGNILVIYDIRNPARPQEVSKWWIPGQHVAGGEKPTWPGRQHRAVAAPAPPTARGHRGGSASRAGGTVAPCDRGGPPAERRRIRALTEARGRWSVGHPAVDSPQSAANVPGGLRIRSMAASARTRRRSVVPIRPTAVEPMPGHAPEDWPGPVPGRLSARRSRMDRSTARRRPQDPSRLEEWPARRARATG